MRSSYSEREVAGLIARYIAMRAKMGTHPAGLNVLVRVADLERGMKLLPAKYRDVIFWHGLAGLSMDEAAALLQISHQAVGKRYRQGLEELVYVMNGGY